MAAIDKTFTKSWDEYCQLKEWAKKKSLLKGREGVEATNLLNCIYDHNESDFNEREIAVMNTDYEVDVYLIRKCPLKFVQDRMKEVYQGEYETILASNKKRAKAKGKLISMPLTAEEAMIMGKALDAYGSKVGNSEDITEEERSATMTSIAELWDKVIRARHAAWEFLK